MIPMCKRARICSYPIMPIEMQATASDWPILPSADLKATADHKLKNFTVKTCQS